MYYGSVKQMPRYYKLVKIRGQPPMRKHCIFKRAFSSEASADHGLINTDIGIDDMDSGTIAFQKFVNVLRQDI